MLELGRAGYSGMKRETGATEGGLQVGWRSIQKEREGGGGIILRMFGKAIRNHFTFH